MSPALIQIEADIIADATARGIWDDGGEMTVRASATSRQASVLLLLLCDINTRDICSDDIELTFRFACQPTI